MKKSRSEIVAMLCVLRLSRVGPKLLAKRRRVLGNWAALRRYVRTIVWVERLKEAVRDKKRDPQAFTGRRWRWGGKPVEYNEKRKYERRKDDGMRGGQKKRTVWRKAGGAEVGIVMQQRLQGRLPMVRPKRRRTEGDG